MSYNSLLFIYISFQFWLSDRPKKPEAELLKELHGKLFSRQQDNNDKFALRNLKVEFPEDSSINGFDD
jgi:hypothetical protein